MVNDSRYDQIAPEVLPAFPLRLCGEEVVLYRLVVFALTSSIGSTAALVAYAPAGGAMDRSTIRAIA